MRAPVRWAAACTAHVVVVVGAVVSVVVSAPVLSAALTFPPSPAAAGPAGGAATDTGGWTVYHGDPAGSGVAKNVSSVDTGTRAWTSSPLDGQLYGEPLVDAGRVYVATENDTVYALSSSTGAVLWSNHLATPVPASSLPCGDIEPTVGITGTPVVDAARGELFVVADESKQGAPAHVLVGLSTATGSTELTQQVDPPGSAAAALLQRTGLTLASGRVVFGFGGNYGDCGTYRGWVVGVPETGGTPVDFGVDTGAGQSQGAVWMGGAAPAVDGAGNVWVGVGNGSVTSASRPYDHSDSVLELSPALRLLQFFAPTSWAADNARDLDLSMAPVLLPDGQVVIAGKSGTAFLLDGAQLGGIGGQRASLGPVCPDEVAGGGAEVGMVVYLPCLSGIVAVRVGGSPPALGLEWSSGTGGGPPIVAAGLVWTIGQDGTLSGLDPTTGSVRQQASVGAPANHFPTPGIGDGVVVAASADRVVAFTASSAPASAAPPPTTSAPGRRGAVPGMASGRAAVVVAGIAVGGVVVIGGVAWLLARRRTRPPR